MQYMSRSVLILSLLLAYLVPAAQSTLDGIKNVAGKDQLWKAKQQLDQYLTVEANANDAEAWKLRSQILYKMITAKQPEVSAFEAHREAFDSYKKYLARALPAPNEPIATKANALYEKMCAPSYNVPPDHFSKPVCPETTRR